METDKQLLERYVGAGSEQAFRELVQRHINLVHSAALRESRGDASMAADITQAVFTELARHAARLTRHPALAGWLYTCVRRITANVRRAEDRRRRREQEALTMNELLGPDPDDNLWPQVRPVLDDVMHELNDQDRAALVLRFFEGRNHKEVGMALGLTENAARMRVERALEKLRGLLSRRGVKSTASTLAGALAAGAAMTAPSTLASTVATGALASATASGPVAFTLSKLMSITNIKVVAAGTLLVLAAAVIVSRHVPQNSADSPKSDQAEPVAAAAAAVAVDSTAQGRSAVAAPTNAAAPSQMVLQVMEPETGAPLPNARILLAYLRQDGRGTDTNVVTDAAGRVRVDALQPPFHYLNMFVTADGHVPKVTSFKSAPLPAEYTMKLERGVTIGGVVTDEAGQAIAGAKIDFNGAGNDMSRAANIQFGPDTATVTDADGRWSCSMIPKDFDQITVGVSHPEHAETSAVVQPDTPEAGSLNIVMKPGLTVTGVVRDSNGNPIAGAKVREVRWNSQGEHSPKTDSSGTFEFKGMKAGELLLAVQAEGFAPAVKTLQLTNAVGALQFQLDPGQVLRGQVTDETGQPITNAWVETLRTPIRKVEWQTWVDADGRFEWDSAPAEPLLYSVEVEGFQRVYALKLQADGSDHEIKLVRSQPGKDIIQITGTAVDADTGVSLDSFKVLVAPVEPDWAAPFHFAAEGKEGQFAFSSRVEALHTNYQIEVEKEGYVPVLTNLCAKDGNQRLEFEVQKGAGPAGVVRLPSGEPAANAGVYLCTTRMGVYIGAHGTVEQQGLNTTTYSAQTDQAGKFSLPAAVAPQGLIVVHDQGFAQLSPSAFASASNITLQPWGRVEGALVLGGQPVADQTMIAGNQVMRYDEQGRRFALLTFRLEAKTDSAGKFSFEKVPPGDCVIFQQQASLREPRRVFASYAAKATVNAGAVAAVTLGGAGRLVVGMAQLPGAASAVDWLGVPVSLNAKLDSDPGPCPRRHEFSSNESFIDAMNRWQEAHRAARTFWAFCDSNGSFRLPDIPAGTYELQIKLHSQPGFDDPTTSPNREQPEIGAITREVIVPESSDAQSGEAVDLGSLALAPK